MLGTIVNVIAVLAGSTVGLLLNRGIPERIVKAVMLGIGLCTLYIGIDGCLSGNNPLITILSIAVGAIIGELIDIDRRVNQLGKWVETKFGGKKAQSSEESPEGSLNPRKGVSIAEGFVTASLLFCVGSMTIVGSLQSGLTGNHEMLFTKSLLDLISSIVFSASMGIGVMLASVFVLVFQGTITLLAQFAAPYLTDAVIAEMTCVGSLLIIGLGLNLLGITKLKIMNYIPAIFLPVLLCLFL